jgi:hypothetical protein
VRRNWLGDGYKIIKAPITISKEKPDVKIFQKLEKGE